MTDTRRAWRVMSGQTLARREWDGEAVLFNDLTGATHLLSSTAVWVLERLQANPLDADALAAALASDDGADDEDEDDQDQENAPLDLPQLAAALLPLLHDLHKMHLIEPC